MGGSAIHKNTLRTHQMIQKIRVLLFQLRQMRTKAVKRAKRGKRRKRTTKRSESETGNDDESLQKMKKSSINSFLDRYNYDTIFISIQSIGYAVYDHLCFFSSTVYY